MTVVNGNTSNIRRGTKKEARKIKIERDDINRELEKSSVKNKSNRIDQQLVQLLSKVRLEKRKRKVSRVE